jgi:hypothetical protein
MPQSLDSITALMARSNQKELDLLSSLRADNGSLSQADRDRIAAEILEEKKKRQEYTDIVQQTTDLHSSYSAQVDSASAQQAATLKMLEEQLAEADEAVGSMADEKNNKIKMTQINTYFGKQYASYTELAIILCIFMLALLIPNLVANLLHIPELAIALRKIIWWVGGLYIAYRVIDLILRRNDNHDEYTWPVAPKTTADMITANQSKGRFIDVSGINIPDLCLGSYCCGPGTDWLDGSGCVISTQ